MDYSEHNGNKPKIFKYTDENGNVHYVDENGNPVELIHQGVPHLRHLLNLHTAGVLLIFLQQDSVLPLLRSAKNPFLIHR